MQTVEIKVSGRVQGVFFRKTTQAIAQQYDITGMVRNESDGSVYIIAHGEEENLKEFIVWCKKGPPAAEVNKIDIEEIKDQSFKEFSIQY